MPETPQSPAEPLYARKQVVKIAEKKFESPEDVQATHIAYGTHTR